jgi:uncharacterized OsmC-like protein
MDTMRRISMTLEADDIVVATNRHGTTLRIDQEGLTGFSPLELLLAALGSCGAVDVALLMRKQRDPVGTMTVEVQGEKVDTRMQWLRVTYRFGEDHDQRKVDRAVTKTAEDLCSVSRTIRMSAPVDHVVEPAS